MTEKRYRTEQIGASLPFIVDNHSTKKHNETMTGYKAYDTNTMKKCEKLTDLLNNYEKEIEQLKQQLFETSKELLWATSDEVDRALYYEDEVEELRKEILE